jgi:hypothetical protein
MIAGSLPPLRGSFRPDLVGPSEEIEALYQEQAIYWRPMSTCCFVKPCPVRRKGLPRPGLPAGPANRSGWPGRFMRTVRASCAAGNPLDDAVAALHGLAGQRFPGQLLCAGECHRRHAAADAASGAEWIGGYANTFTPIPQDWTLGGEKETDGLLTLRSDLDPEPYAAHVADWLAAGATVVGGCCGTRPAHTATMRAMLDGAEGEIVLGE